jgi:hypothetical protein
MKLERVCEISLKFQPPNTITTHLHSFKTTTRFPFYYLSFPQLPRLIILFLLKKLVGTSIFKIELKVMSGEKRATMIRVHILKRRRREVKVDPHLVANGMFQAWWPMEGERKILFNSSHFPPNQFYLNFQFFPLTLRFYFTMVIGHYSRVSFLFLIYKLQLHISM